MRDTHADPGGPHEAESPHDERGRLRRQPRQRGAQHRAAHASRQGRGGAQRAAPRAERAGARRPGACGRGRRPGAADRGRTCERAAPRRRAAHRRGAGRHSAHPPPANPDHDGRVRRRRSHRPADAARPLRAARAVATKVGHQGIRFLAVRVRPAAAPERLGRRRRRREAARTCPPKPEGRRRILAEQTRLRQATRSVGRRRRRGQATWTCPPKPEGRRPILAEQTRFRQSTRPAGAAERDLSQPAGAGGLKTPRAAGPRRSTPVRGQRCRPGCR